MMFNTLALKPLVDINDLSDIRVGDSRFNDDVWDLTNYIEQKTRSNTGKKIRFNIINDNIKLVIKQYAYYKLGKIKPQTVIGYINSKLPTFIQYCELRQLYSLEELDFSILNDYMEWLKKEKGTSERSCFQTMYIIIEIVRVGQVKGWKVPTGNLYEKIKTEMLAPQSWDVEATKYQPIPKDVFDKILFHALHSEKNILTKAGIIIQSQTGLRIGEVLAIKKGCLSTTEEGYTFLEVQIGKTAKGEPVAHKVYANELVKAAVLELEETTETLRENSELSELFIVKNRGVRNLTVKAWTYVRLNSFIKRWDIRDKDGVLYPLKSHQFRATFVRELIKQNVSINHIMKQFSHVSIEMTMHYLTLQEQEVREIYTEMILSPESKIAGKRAEEIKRVLTPYFKGKTTAEIKAFISDLTETMSFNPLPNGICLYDFRRGNCTNGDSCFFYNCPNYITEIQFYPVLKRELDLMELEMERFKKLGRERDWQRQYIKHKHLKKLVVGLEEQIND